MKIEDVTPELDFENDAWLTYKILTLLDYICKKKIVKVRVVEFQKQANEFS